MSSSSTASFVSDVVKPLVTIVIPVYNGADFLAEAIQSALDQTYEAIEIIVVNDGSSDGGATERVAQAFGSSIRYFSKSNGGVGSALNLAILEMSGDYFSWLSHDDLYFNDKIALQIAYLSEYGTSRTIVYSDYSIFTDNHVADAVPVAMPGVQPEHFRYWITAESALHGCSLLIPRSAFDAVGLFNECLRTTQDYELWFRMAEHYQFMHVAEVLLGGRSHAGQDTRKFAGLAFEEAARLYLGFVKTLEPSEVPGNTPSDIGTSYLRLASVLWQRGFVEAAAHCAFEARRFGTPFVHVLGAQLVARSVGAARRLIRTLFSPQARQVIRQNFARISPFYRSR